MQKIKIDSFFTVVLVILLGVGMLAIFSASSVTAIEGYNNSYYYIEKELINVVVGIIALVVVAKVPYQIIRKYIPLINAFTILLLLLVFVPGLNHTANGATRWIGIGSFTLQPSEVAKISVALTLAHMMDVRKRKELNHFSKGILPILIYLGVICGLIVAEKSLSAVGVIVITALFMLIVGGLDKKYIILLFALAMAAGVFGVILEPYRMARIIGFAHQNSTSSSSGYQALQSLYAVGSGHFKGLGIGMSRQKFGWLPEANTDFIMAVVAEETGYVGVSAIIFLVIILVARGMWIAINAPDRFSRLFATGIVFYIFIQATLNLMIVSGIFPVTGVPMPFISYGGSDTILLLGGLGLIYNITSQKTIES